MIAISITISLLYGGLILYFTMGFERIKSSKTKGLTPKTNFTVLIPFRDEAQNLPALLNSIASLKYSARQFEILLINDASKDDYQSIIDDFQSKNNIHLQVFNTSKKSNSPKKDAIATGMKHAKYDWILSTDADCTLPENWLLAFDDLIQNKSPKMIVAPVAFKVKNNFLDNFQNLDFLSLQGSTIGSFGMHTPFLCNGANLCYQKEAFKTVLGFKGNEHIASGDDIFLLEKMVRKYPGEVKYLKSAEVIVTTKPQENLSRLLQQRIRWASKTTAYSNFFGKMTGFIVLTANTYILLLFILAVLHKISWQHVGLFFLLKFNIDFLLIYKTSLFFKQQESLKSYLFSSIFYPIFTFTVALFSLKKGYRWKGREFQK